MRSATSASDRDNVADWPPSRVTLAGLLDHVDAIRRHGYASVDDEFEPGLVGVSAPVYGFRGRHHRRHQRLGPKQRLGADLDEAG
jgi:DNA-binding IclR family transcriptional regulator